ncbi:hypothetical protein [Paenibacillus sp. WC2504]|uniref:hypothetical protein n=1 Tax=Paenibacillus sp. WC2504 TaxID=3461403 RepID=UPI0040464766
MLHIVQYRAALRSSAVEEKLQLAPTAARFSQRQLLGVIQPTLHIMQPFRAVLVARLSMLHLVQPFGALPATATVFVALCATIFAKMLLFRAFPASSLHFIQ